LKKSKVAAVLAERRIAANDNSLPEIDPIDVAVADRKHWLGDLEKGKGYTGFEPHPFRIFPKQPMSRFASIRWREIVPPSEAANDNPPHASRGRSATFAEMKTAAEGLPIEVEVKNGRAAGYLWETIADVRDCYEMANTPVLSGVRQAERRLRAVQACQLLRFRLMHLWRPVVDACVFGMNMKDIGRQYGGNKEDAPKLGRQKVIDGLLLAREALWDLREFESQDDANAKTDVPLPKRSAYALGRKANVLPSGFNEAANQNMRAITSVA
jgi:hypothetical protein